MPDRKNLKLLTQDAVQGFTEYIGLIPVEIAPGKFITRVKLRKHHFQQDGFVHAGLIATLADHTAGYASYTLVPRTRRILTIEYKINFLKPALGDFLECRARVIKPGKQILVAESEIFCLNRKTETLVAKALLTMASVPKNKLVKIHSLKVLGQNRN